MQRDGSRGARRAAETRRLRRSRLTVVILALVVVVAAGILGIGWVLAGHGDKPAKIAVPGAAAAAKSPPGAQASSAATATASSSAISTAVARPAEVPDPAADQAVPVLMYHHIMPDPSNSIAISPATFDAQMSYLHGHGWHPISMAQLRAFVQTGKRLPSKPVLITFDDDRKNQLTYGVPILKKYGFTATFFVPKKWVAGPSPSFMHVSQLKQLIADGYDVESHTADHALIHPAKSRSTGIMESYASMKARYWEPVHGMRVWMDSTLGAPATALAYPGGMYNDDAIRLVRDAGYDLAFTTDDGYVTYKGQSPYALPRWNTGARGTTLARFVSILDRAERHKRAK